VTGPPVNPEGKGPKAADAPHRYRFRLLGCPDCGRTWLVDDEDTPAHQPDCAVKVWLEAHTFFADNREGPGFPLTQVAA
jgi:hypothetical protein